MSTEPTPAERIAAAKAKIIRDWYELTASIPGNDPARLRAEGIGHVLWMVLK